MNNFAFKELFIGQEEFFVTVINKNNLHSFSSISGDKNPLHTNTNFARSCGFEDKVIHGAFIISLFSRLIGMQLPGKKSLLIDLKTKFKNPAYLNSSIKVVGQIVNLHESVSCVEIKLKAQYESEKIISTGSSLVKILK